MNKMNTKMLFSLIGLTLPFVWLPTVRAMDAADNPGQLVLDHQSEARISKLSEMIRLRHKHYHFNETQIRDMAIGALIVAQMSNLDPDKIEIGIGIGPCGKCRKVAPQDVLIVVHGGVVATISGQLHQCSSGCVML